ncbi:hypothetical protein [Rubellimicrobium arenae]|uniref:hypothetical protein n=1 Tax=Rubellimicrobium arenae TaxID=2817372 RepID=UPI001B311F77|nr:hypothetical protein [Rubellimicrobium arenae]
MTPLEVRELLARTTIEKALLRKHRDLNDRALARLVAAAAESGAFRYHTASGTPLPLAEVIGEAEQSEVGRMIFGIEHGSEERDRSDADGLSPALRMTQARHQSKQA